jgi:biopolymer transport protein ExbB/TolQ
MLSRPDDPLGARHPSDAGTALPAALGGAGTLLFYVTIVPLLRGTYAGELFSERGWVPYAISLFAFWALALLAIKARQFQRQSADLALDPLAEPMTSADSDSDSDSDSAIPAALAARVDLLHGEHRGSLLFARIALATSLIQQGGSRRAVLEALMARSQADADAVESSYTLVRVFVWAIPLLGFIGTVLGIGAAVSGFSNSVAAAVDLDVMKQSIGTVTTGLGIAFDTTLLALVVSIAIMLPASLLQKAEEDWLARLDAYLEARLLARLAPEADPSPAADSEALAAVVARLDRTVALLDRSLQRTRDSEPR